MPKNQLKQYCAILKYIRDKDIDLYTAIDDNCLNGIFRPKRTKGVTFLFPADKKYRQEIIDATYGSEQDKAVNMLKALVIEDYMPTPSEFVTKKKDIPNALRQKVEVKSVTGNVVTLENGLTLKIDTEFIPVKSRENMAVYILEGSGRMPLNGAPASYAFAASRKRVKGGRSMSDEPFETKRCTYAKTLENTLIEGISSNTIVNRDPYLEAMCSFLVWADLSSEYRNVYKAIIPYLDWMPAASFYIILEPHMFNASLVPEDMIERWLHETRGMCPCDTTKLPSLYESLLNKAAASLGDRSSALSARKEVQRTLLSTEYKPTLSQAALAAYEGRIDDAFRDELRLLIFKMAKDMCDAHNHRDELSAYQNLVNYMRHVCNKVPTDKAAVTELLCLNQSHQSSNDLSSWISTALTFIRSDCFLYTFVDSKTLETTQMLGIRKIDENNVTAKNPVNLSYIKLQMLREYQQTAVVEPASVDTLNKMKTYLGTL